MAQDALTRFSEALIQEASAQKHDVETALQEERRRRLDAAKQQLAAETEKQLHMTQAKLERELQLSVSTHEHELHKALVENRSRVVEEIFDAVTENLRAFKQSPEYAAYFEKQAKQALKPFADAAVRCTVLAEDQELAQRVFSGVQADIVPAQEDFIGGFTLESEALHLFADYTLREKLEAEKERFCETSGLILDK